MLLKSISRNLCLPGLVCPLFFPLVFLLAISVVSTTHAIPAKSSITSTPEAPKKNQAEIAKSQSEAAPSEPVRAPRITSITRVVGEAGEKIITSREVRINDAIEKALVGLPDPGALALLSGEEKTFPSDVSRVLEEWVVYLEAKALSSASPSKTEVAQAVKQVQLKWGADSKWQGLEVSSEELRSMVERKLLAKDFERLKSDPQLSPVGDDDALEYFNKNRLRFGSLPFESFKDNIKSFLIKNQTDRRLSEWHEILTRKYKVRNFIAG